MRPAIMQIHGGRGDRRQARAGHPPARPPRRERLGRVHQLPARGGDLPEHLIDLKRALVDPRARRRVRHRPRLHRGDRRLRRGLTALMALTANDPEYQPGSGTPTPRSRPRSRSAGCTTSPTGSSPRPGLPADAHRALRDEGPPADEAKFAKASPIDRVRAGRRRSFVIHGDRDTWPRSSRRPPLRREVTQASRAAGRLRRAVRRAARLRHLRVARTALVIEGVERFLDGVRRDWLRGLEARPGAVTEATVVVDGGDAEVHEGAGGRHRGRARRPPPDRRPAPRIAAARGSIAGP